MSLDKLFECFEKELLKNMFEKEYNNKYLNKDKSISHNENEEEESNKDNMKIQKIDQSQLKKLDKYHLYYRVFFDPETKKRKFTQILDEDMDEF
jgi:hypothetical protein